MFNEVKQAVTLEAALQRYLPQLELRPSGVNLVGQCPFHTEKTGSFSVHTRKQIWKCFGCGLGGTVIDLVMATYNCDKVEAARTLAEDFGVWIPGGMPHPRTLEERRKFAQARREAQERAEERQLEEAFNAWCDLVYARLALFHRTAHWVLRHAEDPFVFAEIINQLPQIENHLDLLLYGSDEAKLDYFLHCEEAQEWVS